MSKLSWLGFVVLVTGLTLLFFVSWRVAVGVFLVAWGNNLIYSYRLKNLVLNDLRDVLK